MTPETLERLIALLRLLEQCHLITRKGDISRGCFKETQYAGYYISTCICLAVHAESHQRYVLL